MLPIARFRVEDRSMEPSLRAGDYVLVNRWAYTLRRPRAGDIVVLRHPEDGRVHLVKRVTQVTEQGEAFVMGDNATESRDDSRRFGPVGRERIVGRVWVRARPGHPAR